MSWSNFSVDCRKGSVWSTSGLSHFSFAIEWVGLDRLSLCVCSCDWSGKASTSNWLGLFLLHVGKVQFWIQFPRKTSDAPRSSCKVLSLGGFSVKLFDKSAPALLTPSSSVQILHFSHHLSFSCITVTSRGILNTFCAGLFGFFSFILLSFCLSHFREPAVLFYLQLLEVYLLWKVTSLPDVSLLLLILGMNGDTSRYSFGVCEIHDKFYHLYLLYGNRYTSTTPVRVKPPFGTVGFHLNTLPSTAGFHLSTLSSALLDST